jgi:hypothetical protein
MRHLSVRTRIWDSLQMFFMDTDPALSLENMADVCAEAHVVVGENGRKRPVGNAVNRAQRLCVRTGPARDMRGSA